ncbi:MAG TPA: transcriptional repressor [Stellaceae bacterium]|nr:transcriptional repressor [Stellaceae bacterium]
MDARQLARALTKAEHSCKGRGVRLTRLRRRVLELILQAGQPVGAYALLAQLDDKRTPTTVYRAIDFLLEQKFIHRIESLNAFTGCPDVDHPHDSQFVICTDCGSTEELHDDAIAETLRRHGRTLGFQIDRQVVELRGLCRACRAAAAE